MEELAARNSSVPNQQEHQMKDENNEQQEGNLLGKRDEVMENEYKTQDRLEDKERDKREEGGRVIGQ